jgi:hypothetical protein
MSVQPSSEQWVVCGSCAEIVQQSADPHQQWRYHSPTCPDQARLMPGLPQQDELATEIEEDLLPGHGAADPVSFPPGHGRKTVFGLLVGAGVIAMAAFLVIGRPAATVVPPTADERQAPPMARASNPAGSPSPQTTAPRNGTSPNPRALPSHQPAGGIPVPAPPSSAPSPAGLTPPPGSVLITFQNGTDGWSSFWGAIADAPATSPAFDGTGSLLLTAGSDRYTAVGTTLDVAQLKPGDTVTYHVWSSGQSGSVQPFIYDDNHVARFGQPTNTLLSSSPGWSTLTWTIPATSSVLAIGLQVTNPGSGSLRLAIAALWWPRS